LKRGECGLVVEECLILLPSLVEKNSDVEEGLRNIRMLFPEQVASYPRPRPSRWCNSTASS